MRLRTFGQALAALFLPLLIMACSTTSGGKGGVPETDKTSQNDDNSYDQRTVLGAAREVFGEGAEGIGEIIESVFADLGRPNGYVAGEEAGGAFVGGLRYGAGTLHHKIEGTRPAHWAAPSVGFDFGGNASKVFVLVYNLYDTEDLYQRFPQIEGQFYFVGGAGVSYHKRGDVVIAPVRLGVGLRAGINVGYMKFSSERNYNPF